MTTCIQTFSENLESKDLKIKHNMLFKMYEPADTFDIAIIFVLNKF